MPSQQLSRVNNDDDEVKGVRIANAIKLKDRLIERREMENEFSKRRYSKRRRTMPPLSCLVSLFFHTTTSPIPHDPSVYIHSSVSIEGR